MKTILRLLILASAASALASCSHETYYYRTPRTTTYRSYTPATIPGHAVSLPDPGAPGSFRASSSNY
jgi:hypothetical protein